MKNSKSKFQRFRILFCILLSAFCVFSVRAQSTSQSYPTAITSNEISGTVKARDLGDARLTSFYYTFNAEQGDLFINVVTTNLNGDIDVFTAGNLRPLTKIVVYADSSQSETGRVVYFRKPEKLILRVEGRTPNDDPATFRIKFAGSFQPALTVAGTEEPQLPEVKRENQGDVIVNSVGTIIGVKPKPTPSPAEIAAEPTPAETIKIEQPEKEAIVSQTEPVEKEEPAEIKEEPAEITEKAENQPVVVVTNELEKKQEETPITKREETAEAEKKESERKVTELSPEMKKLEKIRLLVLLKNGDKFERPMSEIFSVNVDRGQLTVITKDGKIERFSIFDVAKMTIE